MSDRIKVEYSRVPGRLDPLQLPIGYKDIKGDESEFGLKIFDTSQNLGTTRTTEVIVGDAPVPLAAANPTRRSLLIVNNSPDTSVYIKAAGTATPDGNSLKIKPEESYSTDVTGDAYSAVTASGATVSVTVEEICTVWPPA